MFSCCLSSKFITGYLSGRCKCAVTPTHARYKVSQTFYEMKNARLSFSTFRVRVECFSARFFEMRDRILAWGSSVPSPGYDTAFWLRLPNIRRFLFPRKMMLPSLLEHDCTKSGTGITPMSAQMRISSIFAGNVKVSLLHLSLRLGRSLLQHGA